MRYQFNNRKSTLINQNALNSTSSQVLATRGSVKALVLLSCEDRTVAVPSIREEKITFSILSGFSSKRIAALTDKILRAYKNKRIKDTKI